MVYQIYYDGYKTRQVLFDIEIYLKQSDTKKTYGLWYVEMHSDSFISGAIEFIKYMYARNLFKPDFDFDEFKKDCKELEELRGWLWETHNNSPRTMDEADKDYQEWWKYVKDKAYAFADKYGLYVNED